MNEIKRPQALSDIESVINETWEYDGNGYVDALGTTQYDRRTIAKVKNDADGIAIASLHRNLAEVLNYVEHLEGSIVKLERELNVECAANDEYREKLDAIEAVLECYYD